MNLPDYGRITVDFQRKAGALGLGLLPGIDNRDARAANFDVRRRWVRWLLHRAQDCGRGSGATFGDTFNERNESLQSQLLDALTLCRDPPEVREIPHRTRDGRRREAGNSRETTRQVRG